MVPIKKNLTRLLYTWKNKRVLENMAWLNRKHNSTLRKQIKTLKHIT